jgi:hypothetical protein
VPRHSSSGNMASSPYKSLKGENWVVLDVVVLWDQITLGNYSAHLLLGRSVMFLLMPAKMTPLARSTAPLDYGW